MCHDPNTLPDGAVVACRKCELCRYNRVKDWAGRNIAQSKISAASFACTLTYGPELDDNRMPIAGRSDHMRMTVLTYSDVQKFLKYLRILGYPCRYFITGEFGAEKERAHWHIILHFLDRVPTHEVGLNFSDRHVNEKGQLFDHEVCKAWPHGFMFWKKATFQDVFYNCKYILKAEDDEESQRKPGMSKKPPIGAEYFMRWADQHVQEHLAPQSLEYKFPEIKKKDGSPLIFRLKGRTAEMFLERFIAQWKAVHGDLPRPRSEVVDLFEKYGKIVTEEARMLLRQEFPQGESRRDIPTGKQIKAMALEAKAELEDIKLDMRQIEIDAWRVRWVGEGKNEQERQKRANIVELERWWEDDASEVLVKQYLEWKAKHGWQFVSGKGWLHSGARPGSAHHDSPAGHQTFKQWRKLVAAKVSVRNNVSESFARQGAVSARTGAGSGPAG
jgi:hypothetical protein